MCHDPNRESHEKRKCLHTDSAEMSDIGATSNYLAWALTMVRRYLGFSGTSVSGGSSGPTMSMWTSVNLLLGIERSWISFLGFWPIFDSWQLKHLVHQGWLKLCNALKTGLWRLVRTTGVGLGWEVSQYSGGNDLPISNGVNDWRIPCYSLVL